MDRKSTIVRFSRVAHLSELRGILSKGHKSLGFTVTLNNHGEYFSVTEILFSHRTANGVKVSWPTIIAITESTGGFHTRLDPNKEIRSIRIYCDGRSTQRNFDHISRHFREVLSKNGLHCYT